MRVLIVDDLENVVEGIAIGVDWKKLGVDEVYKAYGVNDAKSILQEHSVELMLCDIEMPPSDGFALLEWARKRYEFIECIFLTSHAEFDYARRAVKLGSFDYILQPARYSEIEATVSRAIMRIEREMEKREKAANGIYWQEKSTELSAAYLSRFLIVGEKDIAGFIRSMNMTGFAIDYDTEVCLVLFDGHRDLHTRDTLKLREYFGEFLGRTNDNLIISETGEGTCAVLMFGGQGKWGETAAQLNILLEKWDESDVDGTKAAFYMGSACRLQDLHEQWQLLNTRRKNNVARYGGVFVPTQEEEIPGYEYSVPDMKAWIPEIEAGQCAAVRQKALEYLEKQKADGHCTAEFIARFYQDFAQMLFRVEALLSDRHSVKLPEKSVFFEYMHAYTSYNATRDMVGKVLSELDSCIRNQNKRSAPIQTAIEFIHANIEKDIRCADVAEAIFMNEDYLSRLFKKEFGVSMSAFIVSEKLKTAANLLKSTNLPVSLIAIKVGYPNFSYFSQLFKKQTGKTPNEYRNS